MTYGDAGLAWGCKAILGLLTGHNTLRRHLYVMGLNESHLCRRCDAEDQTSARVLCECEALTTRRHTCLASFLLDPEEVRSLSLGAVRNFINPLKTKRVCFI
jgi:hypothetical protein